MLDMDRAFAALEKIADNLEQLNTTISTYINKESEILEKEDQNFKNMIQLISDVKKVDPFNIPQNWKKEETES